jgi:hypothetical protein
VTGLRRVRLPREFGQSREVRPRHIRRLPLARLTSRDLADCLQVLHRCGDDLVDAEVGGDAVDRVEELLARFVVKRDCLRPRLLAKK